MLGRVIKGQNNVPVARIMACVEVTMRVGPASDFSHVSALVDALLDWPMGHVVSVCDNRDFFQLRPIESSDLRLVRNVLRVACGMEDPRTVDWATVLYFDNRVPSTVPDTYVGCALGRSQGGQREVAVSLVFGVAESAPWESLFQLSRRLATGWPDVWRSITVGNRFCSLDYNGFPFAHQAIHRMARRMPSVDVGDTMGIHTAHWTRRLRTVAWTTFVDGEFEAQCAAGRHERCDRVDVWPLSGGGMCVRLRDEPTEGDAPEEELKGYIQADRLLRPVRAADEIAFLPPWNRETSRQWLGRWEAGGAGSIFLSTP